MTLLSLWLRLVPILFVFLWSTGWVAAGFAAPHADPLTFLAIRFALAAVAIALICKVMGVPLSLEGDGERHALVSGVFLHALYLGAVWWAVAKGLPAGISALIAALQPLFTALMAPKLVGEIISPRRWAGISIGFLGIVVALWPKLEGLTGAALWAVAVPILINVGGMVAVTYGTFYQKKHLAGGDLRAIAGWQYVGAALLIFPLAFVTEPMRFDVNVISVATMVWSVIALSVGAIGLLLFLIRRGEVSRAAALIYLVPPVAAVETYVLFGETLSPVQIAGLVATCAGVWLASKG
jgi:drug/metabolite transporter (DMT)-like permease